MKRAATIIAVLALCGCAGDEPRDPGSATSRTAVITGPNGPPGFPNPPPPGTGGPGVLWGFVVDASGGCIQGATVRVVRGQALGEHRSQVGSCDAWAYGGGFKFEGLSAGDSLTLLASAPGHHDREQSFAAFSILHFTTVSISLTSK